MKWNGSMSGAEPNESIYRIDRASDGSLRYSSIRHGEIGAPADAADAVSAVLSGSLVRRPASLRPTREDAIGTDGNGRPARQTPSSRDESSTLCAFGMFWKRDLVAWTGRAALFGRKTAGATPLNFARQIGVYLLQDGARTIYVGRAGDNLYARLKAHTSDRMAGRWNRFSWFGLGDVGLNSLFRETAGHWSQAMVLKIIEALLIESLEPPLNRRRGDGLCGLEYLQALDPKLASAGMPPWPQRHSDCGLPET